MLMGTEVSFQGDDTTFLEIAVMDAQYCQGAKLHGLVHVIPVNRVLRVSCMNEK